jgi:hypothetical protein
MTTSKLPLDRSTSVLGRLLEELSWAGVTIRNYRNGGRGYENVLTAEALQGLDFLPRRMFLGSVLSASQGAVAARAKLVEEIEDACFTLLPGNQYLIPSGKHHQTKLPVQPDGIIESMSTFVLLEAKRIRSSSFQPEQLAREYVLALRDAGKRMPLLWLILGESPPVKVAGHHRLTIADAIALHVEAVLDRAENHKGNLAEALARIDDVVCWITWKKISDIVEARAAALSCVDPSHCAALKRIAESVTRAIAWHGNSDG